MNIYLSHSSSFDFKNELYKPIKESALFNKHQFVLPHDVSDKLFNSKKFLKEEADLMIAEVSYPSFGVGIELGWADMFNVPIVGIYKKGSQVSSSVRVVTQRFFEYEDSQLLVKAVTESIADF